MIATPLLAAFTAMLRPMPRLPPVTTAIFCSETFELIIVMFYSSKVSNALFRDLNFLRQDLCFLRMQFPGKSRLCPEKSLSYFSYDTAEVLHLSEKE
jgi:hypothetical protein